MPAEVREEYRSRRYIPPPPSYKSEVEYYILKHRGTYPDCTEHQTIIDDAKRYAEYRLDDYEYREEDRELAIEFEYWTDELVVLFEKYNYAPIDKATHIPESERFDDRERIMFLNAQLENHTKRRDALRQEKPIEPKPIHRH